MLENMQRKTQYNPDHRIIKSEEWKQEMSKIQQEKKSRRPTAEEMASFEAILGNKVLNWDEIMVQSYGNPGWPRMRERFTIQCQCGKTESKVMTPKTLKTATRHLCKSCGMRINVTVNGNAGKQLNTPEAREKAMKSFADAAKGPGTPENDFARSEIERKLGTKILNWESLRFTRYGNPSTKRNDNMSDRQELKFICQNCGREGSFIYIAIEDIPTKCVSCISCDAMEKRPTKRSRGEIEVEEYLKSLGENVVSSLYSISPGFQVDLYLPEHNLGIEYNGLYWHKEEKRDRHYHITKTEGAIKNGKRLIHIFEDEWENKKEIVKKRLAHITGHTNKSYGARECGIKDPLPGQVRTLLEENHLQGATIYQVAKGAYYDGKLVAVMTFSHNRTFIGNTANENEWELVRFASEGSIPGIASRLLKAFREEYPDCSIKSYADRRWSDGGLYKGLGFREYKVNPPNYWYIVNGKRAHRSNYAKYKLVEQGHDPFLTEEEIMRELRIPRIWDCGTISYILDPLNIPC